MNPDPRTRSEQIIDAAQEAGIEVIGGRMAITPRERLAFRQLVLTELQIEIAKSQIDDRIAALEAQKRLDNQWKRTPGPEAI